MIGQREHDDRDERGHVRELVVDAPADEELRRNCGFTF